MISLPDEYREFARECVAWARTSRPQQQRKQLLELARSWTAAATNLERKGMCGLGAHLQVPTKAQTAPRTRKKLDGVFDKSRTQGNFSPGPAPPGPKKSANSSSNSQEAG